MSHDNRYQSQSINKNISRNASQCQDKFEIKYLNPTQMDQRQGQQVQKQSTARLSSSNFYPRHSRAKSGSGVYKDVSDNNKYVNNHKGNSNGLSNDIFEKQSKNQWNPKVKVVKITLIQSRATSPDASTSNNKSLRFGSGRVSPVDNKQFDKNFGAQFDKDELFKKLNFLSQQINGYEEEIEEEIIMQPAQQLIPINENNMAIFFNIASLFRSSDFTLTPEQFADNAKNFQKWSAKDDNLLVKAFKKYENNWSRIQEELKIPKKTIDDCRNRYDKLQNGNVKGTWMPDEDELILRNVKKFGRNWALIAKKLVGRNGKQIRERYVNYLEKKENLFKDQFTEEEEDLIMKYFDLYPHDWNKISQFITTKSSSQIKKHYVQKLRDKRNEGNSTRSVSISHIRLDFDQVSEIKNNVETLVDPLGNFFRQRLTLMKQTKKIQIDDALEDEDYQSPNWLVKKTSQEDYDNMINQLESQGILRGDSNNNKKRTTTIYQDRYYSPGNAQSNDLNSSLDEQSVNQDELLNGTIDFQEDQLPYLTLGTVKQSSSKTDYNQSNIQLSLKSNIKHQISNKQTTKKLDSIKTATTNFNNFNLLMQESQSTNLVYSSTGITISQNGNHNFISKSPNSLFDFDYLLNNDRTDCDSVFNYSSEQSNKHQAPMELN
ncbi:myb-related protein 3r-1-like [Stylonychia lemnae]|uniref:Myb-related protein 3r-1-like n=1 Tax=Stylonychia lemnae TaxID=5949 RepID=A0A078AKF7_STYLE|nr:myb-related protein 3r-1-like [Stylonychia lemnae]|eukprot:CDW81303.1 myb-related protein 3r-1-like [Stylonychia lemnae]